MGRQRGDDEEMMTEERGGGDKGIMVFSSVITSVRLSLMRVRLLPHPTVKPLKPQSI